MPADAMVSQELQSLHDELATSRRERASTTPPTAAATTPATTPLEAAGADGSAEEKEFREQLRQLGDEATRFFEQAEKNIAEHPAESVIGALLLGILIGRLLGRR